MSVCKNDQKLRVWMLRDDVQRHKDRFMQCGYTKDHQKKEGATMKSHPLNNAFKHGVTAWRLVTRSALSNFVIVRLELYHTGG